MHLKSPHSRVTENPQWFIFKWCWAGKLTYNTWATYFCCMVYGMYAVWISSLKRNQVVLVPELHQTMTVTLITVKSHKTICHNIWNLCQVAWFCKFKQTLQITRGVSKVLGVGSETCWGEQQKLLQGLKCDSSMRTIIAADSVHDHREKMNCIWVVSKNMLSPRVFKIKAHTEIIDHYHTLKSSSRQVFVPPSCTVKWPWWNCLRALINLKHCVSMQYTVYLHQADLREEN